MPVTRHPLTPDNRHLHSVPVDEAAIARLEKSLEQMTGPGQDLVGVFYQTLFARHPALRPLFPPDMTAQRTKLLAALVMVIEHLRTPHQMLARLYQLGASHVGYGALPEHYPLVCAAIVQAMAETHGNWSDDLAHEWRTALDLVSEIMLSGARGLRNAT